MIKEMKPLTIVEAKEIVETKEGNEEIKPYMEKFVKIKREKNDEMRKELESLDNHKIKNKDIVKVIDFLPDSSSEVNKIFTDISLDENEIKQIIEIVKKYK
jgi:DNA-directed RNA polymerase subunit F